ncbi:hypothetical protein CUC15_17870 [Oceanobacillus zhaokaii]|uniref:Uncharacterized protein n=1 Tax=Oceanobacillus zhaokaii TaxID=2052660 RepID=A0A345PL14_9BACI|nr:hypothetical protein CUC15_17870 [Oceanobacillus zhaokaii]
MSFVDRLFFVNFRIATIQIKRREGAKLRNCIRAAFAILIKLSLEVTGLNQSSVFHIHQRPEHTTFRGIFLFL